MERYLAKHGRRISPPAAYAMALGGTVLVALVRYLLLDVDILGDVPYLLFAIPILLGAWFGGWGPGLAATGLGAVAASVLLIPDARWRAGSAAVGVAIFLAQGVLITYLGAARLRVIGFLAEAARQMESRVQQRTHELSVANERLRQEALEREKASEELRVMASQLETSNRELQDFASIASHDLQEPLRKIQAFGDRLAARYSAALGADGADSIRRMQSAARRMQTLINDLLTLSRVASKAQPFREVDLREITGDVISDLEARIADTGARVCIGDLPRLEADPTQMRQLLQNLIGNALKFRRTDAPPEVQVYASIEGGASSGETANGQTARISISDNGIGFDEKYLDRIFTVFQRLHGRGEYEGTGIGLSVCRRIVERHGGSISARSRPGEGATFVVTLPVHQKQGNTDAATA